MQAFSDPRIRYFRNPERTSLLYQTNRCLSEARADLVACLDQDDVCEFSRLQEQVAYMAKHQAVTVSGTQLTIIDGEGKLLGYRFYPCEHEAIIRAMPYFDPLANPSVIFRKEAVLQAGGYQLPFVDYELWCRMARMGAVFANLPVALVRYRIHPDSLSKGTKVLETLRATIRVKEMHWQGDMKLGARLRLWVERLLLFFPPRLIVWLFLQTQIVKVKRTPRRLVNGARG